MSLKITNGPETSAPEVDNKIDIEYIKSYEQSFNYCPNCGEKVDENKSFIDRYFLSERNIDFFWCNECTWRGEIVRVTQVTATELDEG